MLASENGRNGMASTKNPLGSDTEAGSIADMFDSEIMSNDFTKSRQQVQAESLEAEDGQGNAAEELDFFDLIARALVVGMKLDPDAIQEHLKTVFDSAADRNTPLVLDEFLDIVQDRLKLQLSSDEQIKLIEQVHGESPKKGDRISIADFLAWWDTFFEVETVDPFRAAVAAMEKSNVISPTSDFRGHWDLTQAIFLFYIAIMLPYRIGFDHDVALWSVWFWLDLAIDFYFVCDLMINFRTAIITQDGELLYQERDIAKAYLKGWFPIDFVSCLPFGYIPYISGDTEGGATNKATRMLRMFRLLKLLRLVRIKRILDRWEEEMYGARMLKMAKILVLVGGSAHWVACLWYFAGYEAFLDGGYTMPNGERTDGWQVRRYGSQENLQNVSRWDKYKDSFFWSSMAVVMIDTSERGMTPETYFEKGSYMMGFAVGAIIIASIIGQISDMIAHANPGDQAKSDAVGMVHAFLYERHVGMSLTRRCRSHFNQLYSNRGTTQDMQSIFNSLPRGLSIELAKSIGFVDDLRTNRRAFHYKVPFCRGLSVDDMIKISCKMFHCVYEPPSLNADGSLDEEQYIMRQGNRSSEMWVILDGKVRVEVKTDEQTVDLGKLGIQDFFGEIAVLAEESPGVPLRRTRSAYGITQTVLTCVLSHASMKELRRESPTIDATVQKAATVLRKNRPEMFSQSAAAGDSVLLDGASASEQLADLAARQVSMESEMRQRLDAVDNKLDQLLSSVSR